MSNDPSQPPARLRSRQRKLARLRDVAARAGVSTATADRVLNRRPGVRQATAERVIGAARELQYVPDAFGNATTARPTQLAVLLPAGTNRFLAMLGQLFASSRDQLMSFNMRVRVEFIEGFKPILLANRLRQVGKTVDGVAFMALEHPSVREAVNDLADRGVPSVTLISDITNAKRSAYVGLDNRAAGRSAAYLIGRFIGDRPAKIAMIAGSRSYRAHEERELGFLHLIEEFFPAMRIVGLREGHDDEAKNYRQTKMLLAQHPDISGIYNIGGAALGIARALREAGLHGKVTFLGHGLTPDTRQLLIEGVMDAVINQSPQATLMECIGIFANHRAGRPALEGIQHPRSEIILRENLP